MYRHPSLRPVIQRAIGHGQGRETPAVRYLLRKLGFYLIAAWVALTINFLLPQLIPGNPVEVLLTKMSQAGPVPVGEDQGLTKLLGLGGGGDEKTRKEGVAVMTPLSLVLGGWLFFSATSRRR